jgi:hypothetical protein
VPEGRATALGTPSSDDRSAVSVVEQPEAAQPRDLRPPPVPVERDDAAGVAWVRFEVPPGSRLFLDGVRFATPIGPHSVTPGTHDLDVVTPAQQSYRRRFTAPAGDTIQVVVRP